MRLTFLEKLGLAGALAALVAFITLLVGWVMNLFALVEGVIAFDPSGNWALLLARLVGIFLFPLGGILGFF